MKARHAIRMLAWRAWLWTSMVLMRTLIFVLGRFRVEGRANVPRHGPFILAVNHNSHLDPLTLGWAARRTGRFMARHELFDQPVIGLFFRFCRCIKVRRYESDIGALRESEKTLRNGEALAIFPEGTRSRGRGLGKPYPGLALIALRTDALIVPAGISGTDRIFGRPLWRIPFRRPLVTVRFGEPFRLPRVDRARPADIEQGTTEIATRIARLLPEDYRGEYGRSLLEGGGTPVPAGTAALGSDTPA